jgi:hypothetical protein
MNAHYTSGRLIAIVAIIVGVILSLLAIGFFSDQHPYGLPNYRQSLKLPCGLTVYSPKEQTKVKFPLTIYGYANGCGWTLAGDSVGTVEVLGMNGIVLYRGSLPKQQADDDTPIYFERTISLVIPLGHTRGVVVLKNNGIGSASERVVIPVLFK